MLITKKYFLAFSSIIILAISALGQQIQYLKPTFSGSPAAFPNPLVSDAGRTCLPQNLNTERFDKRISPNQQMLFCQAVQEISVKLDGNWSPVVKNEMRQIWRVFFFENVKIRPLGKDASSNTQAMAEAFTEETKGVNFNANLYFRPERVKDETFFPIFMHELRHIFDMYLLWKNKTNMTEAEMEKRAFRLVGKINQELNETNLFSTTPTFWKINWRNLSASEIDRKRDEEIDKVMRNSSAYKYLLENPEKYLIGYSSKSFLSESAINDPLAIENNGEKLPNRLDIRQTKNEIPQQIKDISFRMEKNANSKNPDQLLRAALINEKNLSRKMDNFVYDQNLQLQCWKKQKVTENYELKRSIARTNNGEALFENESIASSASKSAVLPSCVADLEMIKSDATDTFWAAPYLDKMAVKFDYFTNVDNIPVARYTVYEPTRQKFNQIASQHANIKNFRVFVGTIFVSIEDAQIIKFWGTSFPEAEQANSKSARVFGSYSATAIREKLASGIWVTTLLNTVAVTDEKDRIKPFSYIVKYQNYRQGTTDVTILDDEIASR
jgi:hypothetical protein